MDEDFDVEILREAAAQGRIHWHQHALQRFVERGLSRVEVVHAIMKGEIIEVYREGHPYPSCLMLYIDTEPIHVVAAADPLARICHIITAYRPDLEHFESDFKTRRTET